MIKLITIASVIVICTINVRALITAVGDATVRSHGGHSKYICAPRGVSERCHVGESRVGWRLYASKSKSDEDRKRHQRQLVIFRPPSRHTYGFVDDSARYDLPQLELGSLIHHFSRGAEFQFIPVVKNIADSHQVGESTETVATKRNTRMQVQNYSREVQNLYWIDGDVSVSVLAKAASRAILTHATCLIDQSHEFTEEEWADAAITLDGDVYQAGLDAYVDVIDMTNQNLSGREKTRLVRRISSLLYSRGLSITEDIITSGEAILLYHKHQSEHEPTRLTHYVRFGWRTAIGKAGTRGAPSRTLRRTHRGILKQYALKQRSSVKSGAGDFARSNISTAMEPEIGFLMANLAMSGKVDSSTLRVLDPCCGSGSLLLYAAALGAAELVGVDSDASVWQESHSDFQKHHLPSPTFVEGDVFNATETKELSRPNSFDAIVVDPPYNIGAPIIVDKQEVRQRNRFTDNVEVRGLNQYAFDKACDITDAILHFAASVLVDGGRIVFFLPVKGNKQPTSAIEHYQGMMQSQGFDLVFEKKQQFTKTFSRWLVCLEKPPR